MVNFFSKKNKKPKPTSLGYYRCDVCNKKVLTVMIAFKGFCKCEKLHCSKHRFPAVRDLARRLDPGRVLLLSTIFFRLAFLRFLTKISIFREGRVHVRKERKMTWVKNEQN